MVPHPPLVTVVGGTGFLGTYVVRQLVRHGYSVRVLCRHPQGADAGTIKTQGALGQVSIEFADLSKPATLKGKLVGSHAVVNLVGVLYEKGSQSFARLHAKGAELLATESAQAGVKRFIQLSALGVERAVKSRYARTKLAGEMAVTQAMPNATILRPSVIFGSEDHFFNQFASMSRFAPLLPIIGGGRTKFQPVYVDDVAAAVVACIKRDEAQGKIYELGGPEVLTFRQIIDYTLEVTDRSNGVLDLPFVIAGAIGSVAQFMPSPVLTRDQVALLRYDNTVNEAMPGFAALGINPQAMELIVPAYLDRFKLRQLAA